MCIDNKGNPGDLLVGPAKFLHVGLVKCEQVIVEYEHFNITVVFLQVLDLLDHLLYTESSYIVKLFETAFQVVLVCFDHHVIEAVSTGEWAAS